MSGESAYREAERLIGQGRLAEALPRLREAAAAGWAAAQLRLAQYLLNFQAPEGVPEALRWLHKACDASHPGAAYLAACVAQGGLHPLTPEGAAGHLQQARWLLHAAQAGLADARRAVALLMAEGPADGADPRWLIGCARGGDRLAVAALGETPSGGAAAQPEAGLWPSPEALAQRLAVPSFEAAGQVLAEAPLVQVVDEVLSALACRYLCAAAAPRLSPSQVRDPALGVAVRHPLRSSSDTSFDPLEEDFVLRWLQRRMAAAAGLPLSHAEPLVVLRYRPGEEYRPHRDDLPPSALQAHRPDAGQRCRTVCAYLAEVPAGGETDFPRRGVRVAPRAGRCVVFDHLDAEDWPLADSLHAGLPVREGEKWLATLWMRRRPYRHY
jgi:hypothetical protein